MTSKEVIESWAANSEYTAFVGGNPWISYWKSKQEEYPHNNYILYTLQAQDARKNFPDSLITCIKELKIKWFVRLHPNWYFKKGELVDFLEEKGLLLNLDDPNSCNTCSFI